MTTTSLRPRSRIVAALCAAVVVALFVAPSAQAQDFTRYVALGDSLGAGFLNGGLVDDAQERSYPALIARQAGVSPFDMPLISDPGIPPLLAIAGFSNGVPILAPRSGNPGAPINLNLPRPYDNLSVPGFRIRDVLQTRTGNALIDIILRGQGTAFEQAAFQRPTFTTLWIGNNDVLGAATSGIVVDGVTLTPFEQFREDLRTIVGILVSSDVQSDLAIATIPDVTVLPFVNTVPPVVVNPATRQPVIGPNGQPIPLIGPNGPLGPGDRVLLPATALLAQGIGIPAAVGGTNQPLPNSAVLSAAEVAAIQQRTAQFNAEIRLVAQTFGTVRPIALVPIDTRFAQIAAQGYPVGGNIVLTTDYLTGGLFSYDGVHPTPLGYAVVANEFITAMNARFGDAIPLVDLTPFLFGPDGSAGATIELPGLGAGTPIFSAAAYEALRLSLGVPTAEELEKAKTRPRRMTPRTDGGLVQAPPRAEVTRRPR